jgi:hypothetical protein
VQKLLIIGLIAVVIIGFIGFESVDARERPDDVHITIGDVAIVVGLVYAIRAGLRSLSAGREARAARALEQSQAEAEMARLRIEEIELYFEDNPNRARYQDAVLTQQASIGMNKIEAQYAWGFPSTVNRSVYKSGRQAQWVYYGPGISHSYLYFSNDILSAIQY